MFWLWMVSLPIFLDFLSFPYPKSEIYLNYKTIQLTYSFLVYFNYIWYYDCDCEIRFYLNVHENVSLLSSWPDSDLCSCCSSEWPKLVAYSGFNWSPFSLLLTCTPLSLSLSLSLSPSPSLSLSLSYTLAIFLDPMYSRF